MKEFILKYWIEVAFTGMTSLAIYYARLVKKVYSEKCDITAKDREEQKLIKDGILAVLHDRVYVCARKHLREKHINLDDLENFDYLYRSYSALGGNGICKRLYEKVLNVYREECENEKN